MAVGTLPALLAECAAFLPEPWPAKGVSRRGVIAGLVAAPFVIRTAGLLMPVRAQLADADDVREWLRQDTLRKTEAAVREILRLRGAAPICF